MESLLSLHCKRNDNEKPSLASSYCPRLPRANFYSWMVIIMHKHKYKQQMTVLNIISNTDCLHIAKLIEVGSTVWRCITCTITWKLQNIDTARYIKQNKFINEVQILFISLIIIYQHNSHSWKIWNQIHIFAVPSVLLEYSSKFLLLKCNSNNYNLQKSHLCHLVLGTIHCSMSTTFTCSKCKQYAITLEMIQFLLQQNPA